MFPIPWTVAVIFWLAYACVGVAIGACISLFVLLVSKAKISGNSILLSGLVGVCGFFVGCVATLFTAWPVTTESHSEGRTLVASTMRGYQHPERIGFLFALLFSLAWTLYRVKRDRSRQTLSSE
jgi:hypothetical protein